MAMDSFPTLEKSWMNKVLGQGAFRSGNDEDFEFKEGDFVRTTVNGIPTISFSERVQQILVRDMVTTVVYLTVQSWTPKFNPLQAFPNSIMVWVRFLSLLGFLYKRRILEEIEGLILVNGVVQRIEFESLPFVYFSCGRFGYMKDLCLDIGSTKDIDVGKELTASDSPKKGKVVELTESFGT
ncbi:hypothetical protein Gotri_001402 [Gossypium trilobum]|uniref:DUF4283 domain-containing protein n=1 Tax=Gossypium trilobum TaxID=34281 RepID=A0A7J9FEL2_9ROSI|nr:hypothetical protein [Gossypium trilobum]